MKKLLACLLFVLLSSSVLALSRTVSGHISASPTPSRQWGADGIILNNTPSTSNQMNPASIYSSDGKIIVVWMDSFYTGNNYYMDIMVQKFDLSGSPVWANPVRLTNGRAYYNSSNPPLIVSDGAGGAIISWEDGSYWLPVAQRVNSSGSPLWNQYDTGHLNYFSGGVYVFTSTAGYNALKAASDGAGGAYFTWTDYRNYSNPSYLTDIYAQRLDSNGTGWAADLQVASAADGRNHYLTNNPQCVQIVLNKSTGGAIIAAYNQSPYQYLNPYGYGYNTWISTYWIKSDGTQVLTDKTCDSSDISSRYNPSIAANDSGECFVTWQDGRNANGSAYQSDNIYCQKYSSGRAPLWTANGVKVNQTVTNFYTVTPAILADNAGGAYITWGDNRNSYNPVYAQRVTSQGVASWAADSQLSNSYDSFDLPMNIISDGSGGALVCWNSYDNNKGIYVDYAQRVGGDGQVGGNDWPAYGVNLNASANDTYGYYNPIVPDGSHGALIAWGDFRAGVNGDIYGQRISANGDISWASGGTALAIESAESISMWAASVPDGSGGAVVTWFDNRLSYNSIFAQRFDPNGNPLWGKDGVAVDPDSSSDNPSILPAICHTANNFIITWSRGGSGGGDDNVNNKSSSLTSSSNPSFSKAPGFARNVSPGRSTASSNTISASKISRSYGRPGVWAQMLDLNGNPIWNVIAYSDGTFKVGKFVKGIDNVAHPAPVDLDDTSDYAFPAITADDASGGAVIAFLAMGSGGSGGPENSQTLKLGAANTAGKPAGMNFFRFFNRPNPAAFKKTNDSGSRYRSHGRALPGQTSAMRPSQLIGGYYIFAKKILSSGQLDSNWGIYNYDPYDTGIQVSYGGYDAFPSVCKLDDGSCMVAWDYYNNDSDTYSIMGQKIKLADGSLVWPNELPIQSLDNGWSTLPTIVKTGSQEILAVWADWKQGTDDGYGHYDIYGQKCTVNDSYIHEAKKPASAKASDIVPLWSAGGNLISITSHPGTNPNGDPSPYDNYLPRVTILPNGNACVAWFSTYAWDLGPFNHDWPSYPYTGHIYLQTVDMNGNPMLSSDFPVAQESKNSGKQVPFVANTSQPNEVYVTWDYNTSTQVKPKCIYGQKISFPSSPSSIEAPTNVSGSALSTSSIRWSWSHDGRNISNFIVFADSGTAVATLSASTLSYDESGLAPNSLQRRYVMAFNSSLGIGASSAVASAYSLADVPTGITTTAASSSSLSLTWNGDGSKYSIERAPASSGPWSYLAGDSFADAISSASFIDTGLASSTNYWYRVSAFNGDGIRSAPSAAASFSTTSGGSTNNPVVNSVSPGTRLLATETSGAFSLTGFNFKPGATVILRKAGQPDITGGNVTVSADGTLANFSASLPGKSNTMAVGYWDIIVTNPDGGTYTLPKGFLFEYPEGQVFFYPSQFSTIGIRASDTSTQPRIAYTLSADKPVDVFVYDVRDMKVVFHRQFASGQTGGKFGYNEIFWNARSDFGGTLANGSYVLQAYTRGVLIGQTYFTVKN